jgi:hypothetical protein
VASYQYSLDNGPFAADTPVATPISLSGLTDGSHTLSVLGSDAAGNRQPADSPTTASLLIKSAPPLLTLTPVAPLTSLDGITIGGSFQPGATISATVDSAAQVGPITVGGSGAGSWSCNLTGLAMGSNKITVLVQDFFFNTSSTLSAVVTRVASDGNFKGSGVTDVSDALRALRIAVGLSQAGPLDLMHGDVAPLVNGRPAPDGQIDLADSLVILKKAVGLLIF